MRLNIGMLRPKQLLCTIDGQLLDFIGVFTAAVIAFAGIPFGVFVGENSSHRFEHRFGDEVLRRD